MIIEDIKFKTRFANDDGEEVIGIIYDTPTDGLFQVYWPGPNKQLRYEWYYKDGKQDGISKGWTSTGKLKQMRNWKNGELISKKEWNNKGEVITNEKYG